MIRAKSHGFTIVELLIVIVVIGILAAITIVAYNGVQQRARDTTRTSDISNIRKALEAYRTDHDRYPPHIAIGTNAPAGFSGVWGASYSYSVATDDSWLKNLVGSGIVSKIAKDPANDNAHYYAYWSSGPNGYGACTEAFYVLAVQGYENTSSIPSDSRGLNCTLGAQTANWTTASNRAVFSNTVTPTP